MKLNPLYFLLTLMLFSCEDAFETTLDIDIPEPPDIIQFSSFISESDFPQFCQVGRILSLEEDLSDGWLIDGASVELRALDRNEKLDFDYRGFMGTNVNFELMIEEGWLVEGENYELAIDHPDYPSVTARQYLAPQIPYDQLIFLEDAGLDEEGESSSGIEITITDPAGDNYYELSLHLAQDHDGSAILTNSIDIRSTDPSIVRGNRYETLLIDDETFDGTQKTILVKFDDFYVEEKESLYVVLRNISEDHYRFSKTTKLADESEDNPFQTPVQIHSNGEGGFGIFSLYSRNGAYVL